MAKAWDMLHDPEVGGQMETDDFLELCVNAGFTQKEAKKAALKRANDRMDRDLKP